jgi:hypothetical protein
MGHWARFQCALLRLPRPDELTLRQFFLLVYEEAVAEHRAMQLDYAARVDFTKEGESIDETRTIVNRQYLDPDEALVRRIEEKRAEAALRLAADNMIDLG